MSKELPAWPAILNRSDRGYALLKPGVDRAREVAWEARCRLAVEALNCLYPGLALDLRYATGDDDLDALRSRVKTVEQAIRAIGPLPPCS